MISRALWASRLLFVADMGVFVSKYLPGLSWALNNLTRERCQPPNFDNKLKLIGTTKWGQLAENINNERRNLGLYGRT